MARFYWLKLKRDFFKRHDVIILESMPNGKEYLLFFVKLMVESIDHEGALRFSDDLPYDKDMLAVITNTDRKTVDDAMEVLKKFGLVEIMKDGTFYIPMAFDLVGSAEDNDAANRQRRHREKMRAEHNSDANVTECHSERDKMSQECHGECDKKVTNNNESKSKSKSKSKIEEKEKKEEKRNVTDIPSASFKPPTIEEIRSYCEERKNGIDPEAFFDFYSSKNWFIGKNKMKDFKACIRTWEKRREPIVSSSKPQELPYMQNEYTEEQVAALESDPLADLNDLLGLGG